MHIYVIGGEGKCSWGVPDPPLGSLPLGDAKLLPGEGAMACELTAVVRALAAVSRDRFLGDGVTRIVTTRSQRVKAILLGGEPPKDPALAPLAEEAARQVREQGAVVVTAYPDDVERGVREVAFLCGCGGRAVRYTGEGRAVCTSCDPEKGRPWK